MNRRLALIIAAGALAIATGPAGAADPPGADRVVSSASHRGDIAPLPDGGYAVAYITDSSPDTVQLKRYADNGGEVLVQGGMSQAGDGGSIGDVAVAAAPDGRIMVVWIEFNSGEGQRVLGRVMAADGFWDGGEQQLNDDGAPGDPTDFHDPDVAAGADGRFVAVWSGTTAAPTPNLFVRTLGPGATGQLVVSSVSDASVEASVTVAPGGDPVVAFQENDTIEVKRVGNAGNAVVPIETSGVGESVGSPEIAWTTNGFTLVAETGGSGSDVFARRFAEHVLPMGSASYLPAGSRVTVNVTATGKQVEPHLAIAPDGTVSAAWSNLSDGLARGRRLSADLVPLGDEFALSEAPAPSESAWGVATQADRFFALWSRDTGTEQALRARRFPFDTAAPPPPPQPQPQPQPPAQPRPLPAFRAAVTLPPANRCMTPRRMRIVLRHPPGFRLKTTSVFFGTRRVAIRGGTRPALPITFRTVPRKRFVVRVVVRFTDGRTITGRRTYTPCRIP